MCVLYPIVSHHRPIVSHCFTLIYIPAAAGTVENKKKKKKCHLKLIIIKK